MYNIIRMVYRQGAKSVYIKAKRMFVVSTQLEPPTNVQFNYMYMYNNTSKTEHF